MKKFAFIIFSACLIVAANAQAPSGAVSDLNSRYSNPQSTWAMEGNEWVASFQQNNVQHKAFYNQAGEWMGTETPTQLTALNSATQEFITTRFMDAQGGYVYVGAANRNQASGDVEVAYLFMENGQRTLKLFFANGQMVQRVLVE